MYFFPTLEPVCYSMSSSNCCFLTCMQSFQKAGKVVWYFHLVQNFSYLVVICRVKCFSIGTSRLSHWKRRFLGLFGRTFLLCLCPSSAVVHLKKKHPKGKKSCLQGCPVAEGGQEQLSTESHRLRYVPSVLPPHTCPCTGLEKN